MSACRECLYDGRDQYLRRIKAEEALAEAVEVLRAQLAAVEKERDDHREGADAWFARAKAALRERDALSKDYAALVSTYEKEVGALTARVAQLEAALEPTGFEGGWKEMEARGYQYGRDALVNVAFGWRLAFSAIRARAGLPAKG